MRETLELSLDLLSGSEQVLISTSHRRAEVLGVMHGGVYTLHLP